MLQLLRLLAEGRAEQLQDGLVERLVCRWVAILLGYLPLFA